MGSAFEIPNLRFSAEAAATVARRRFIKLDSAGKAVQATAGDSAIGVSLNSAATGEVLEIVDGITIVEAGAKVDINAVVQSDANGKAAELSTGIPLGTAMTAAAAAGVLIAVKTPCAGAVGDVTVESAVHVVTMPISDLSADADITSTPLFVVPTGYTFEVLAVDIISQGTAEGIDADNTCVLAVANGSDAIAGVTYNAITVFPAAGAAGSLGVITNKDCAAGDVISLAVTNGATANPPGFIVQITGNLAVAS